jgi:hypothetical protein
VTHQQPNFGRESIFWATAGTSSILRFRQGANEPSTWVLWYRDMTSESRNSEVRVNVHFWWKPRTTFSSADKTTCQLLKARNFIVNNPFLSDENIFSWERLACENKRCFLWGFPDAIKRGCQGGGDEYHNRNPMSYTWRRNGNPMARNITGAACSWRI